MFIPFIRVGKLVLGFFGEANLGVNDDFGPEPSPHPIRGWMWEQMPTVLFSHQVRPSATREQERCLGPLQDRPKGLRQAGAFLQRSDQISNLHYP